jgi:predicted DNA-binding transcriptional regulator YafY
MSRHLERLLEIDSMIRERTRFTTQQMAERLEVSDRTIRNDLAFLRDRFNAPLAFCSVKGHHYTDSEWRLPSINLSMRELSAIMLGAKMLESYTGSAYVDDLNSAILRLSERIPDKIRINREEVGEQRIIFTGGAETHLDTEICHSLVKAVNQTVRVKIEYYTASRDQVSQRIIDPYVLRIDRGTNYYMIGFCHNRQDMRYFRVDRIKKLKLLNSSFIRDKTFNVQEYLGKTFQIEVGTGEAKLVKIWFSRSTSPYIIERRWHKTQKVEEHTDGSITLEMEVAGLNDLKRWVLGYGGGAVVKEPPELVDLVKSEVEQLMKNYQM